MSREAITVTTETTIDWWELGRLFADAGDEDQAQFLHGAAVGFQEMGVLGGGVQLIAAGDEIRKLGDENLRDVREFIDELLARIS